MIVNLTGYTPEPRYDSVPWTHARIEEATEAAGPWTAIDTLALSPVDADPEHPATRSFTTTHATLTAGWYRVVWVDAALLESATPPVHNILPFASAADLEVRLGQDFSDAEAARANKLLADATGLIQTAAAGQLISLIENDTLTMAGTNDERILLPQRPVVSVASVTIDGAELVEGTHWYLDRNSIVRMPAPLRGDPLQLNSPYLLGGNRRGFGWPTQTLEIIYTHGYADPPLVKAIAIEAVTRVWVNPGAVIEEVVGNTRTMYSMRSGTETPSGLLLTPAEEKKIRRFFGQVAARSIPIGG